jgi:hypothetical protein
MAVFRSLLCLTAFVCLAPAQESLANLKLLRTVTLEGNTHHVQSLVADGASLWVTSVDRAAGKGFLYEYSLDSGKRLREVEVQQGAMIHPGGFDMDEDSLWIPVAEYNRNGKSVIQRRSKQTLALLASFPVPDHIGCLTLGSGVIYGGNWDTRTIYEWTPEGKQLRARKNPNAAHYQDIKLRYGALIASGGLIHWLDPETLLPLRTLTTGKTDRGVSFANEGMDIRDGRLYLLPEDAPSRLFVFEIEP